MTENYLGKQYKSIFSYTVKDAFMNTVRGFGLYDSLELSCDDRRARERKRKTKALGLERASFLWRRVSMCLESSIYQQSETEITP